MYWYLPLYHLRERRYFLSVLYLQILISCCTDPDAGKIWILDLDLASCYGAGYFAAFVYAAPCGLRLRFRYVGLKIKTIFILVNNGMLRMILFPFSESPEANPYSVFGILHLSSYLFLTSPLPTHPEETCITVLPGENYFGL
jgi:hypothetical protein